MAEDEENCEEEYKRKNIVAQHANFRCQSPNHNTNSSPILSSVWFDGKVEYDVPVIEEGTIVYTFATRCDAHVQCWDGSDEENCNFSTTMTISIGKIEYIVSENEYCTPSK